MLKVNNISKSFNGLCVLDGISFDYSGDSILGIVGPNGSGKTTLLNIISGNTAPSSGDIFYEGKRMNGCPLHKRAAIGIARTYQDGKVFPNHTLRENLLLVRKIEKSTSSIHDVEDMLQAVGLGKDADKMANTLSFGQKRRLELAMTMMRSKAKLYLLDEPTSGVDPGFLEEFRNILKNLRKRSKGVIIIEHNLNLIREIVDQLIVLDAGKILAMGTPIEVLQRQDVHDAYLGGLYAS